jgi:hypothetical protein
LVCNREICFSTNCSDHSYVDRRPARAEGSLLLALYGWMESGASPPYTRQNGMKLCCPARFCWGVLASAGLGSRKQPHFCDLRELHFHFCDLRKPHFCYRRGPHFYARWKPHFCDLRKPYFCYRREPHFYDLRKPRSCYRRETHFYDLWKPHFYNLRKPLLRRLHLHGWQPAAGN